MLFSAKAESTVLPEQFWKLNQRGQHAQNTGDYLQVPPVQAGAFTVYVWYCFWFEALQLDQRKAKQSVLGSDLLLSDTLQLAFQLSVRKMACKDFIPVGKKYTSFH